MTHHVGFTLELEVALQAVDRTVSVPFWEYTIDEYEYCERSWGSDSSQSTRGCWERAISSQSPIFDQDWFGAAAPSNQHHIVTEGRWGYTGIPSVEVSSFTELFAHTSAGVSALTQAPAGSKGGVLSSESFPTTGAGSIRNPFGLLRSPWNTNPIPYLSRSFTVINGVYEEAVGCDRFHSAFQEPSLAKLFNALNGATHGPIHILTGGQWSVEHPLFSDVRFAGLAGPALLLFKWLWRWGFVDCPSACDSGSPCACSSPESLWHGRSAYGVLRDTGVLHYIDRYSSAIFFNASDGNYHIADMMPEEETSTWTSILSALADPGSVGEMYSSAAPADPLFWVIHTTADRLMSWRRIQSDLGSNPLDDTWDYFHNDDTSDMGALLCTCMISCAGSQLCVLIPGRVCDWTGATPGVDLPKCSVATCPGHEANELIPFGNVASETFTNREFFEFMHPFNEELPYVYDTFQWPHCEDLGFSFNIRSAAGASPS